MNASKLRAMAETLAREIARKRAPRRENTPKQVREATSARIESDHLERVRDALLALADAAEAGPLPDELCGLTKAALLTILRTRVDTSGGYYSVRDTGDYSDQSERAVYVREWLAAVGSHDPVAHQRLARQRYVEELERAVKFADLPGFFPTPAEVVGLMVQLAELEGDHSVLEPSAGKGDIAEAVRGSVAHLDLIEVQPRLCELLRAKGLPVEQADFLTVQPPELGYARVMMNPPFEDGQEMDHVRHAYEFLRPGGRLVSIMSAGPFYRSDRKATDFREWFSKMGGELGELPVDAFRNSFRTTSIKTYLVAIDRRPEGQP